MARRRAALRAERLAAALGGSLYATLLGVGQEHRVVVNRDGLTPDDTILLCEALLRSLRPWVSHASVDLVSDRPWPSAVAPVVERLRLRVRRQSQSDGNAVTVWLDPTNDADFADLVALAPYTIGLEGFAHDRPLLDTGDTGASISASVTNGQEAALRSAIADAGLPDDTIEYWQPRTSRLRLRRR